MKCPHCDETLLMTERQGIEIDYCPKCRGVWLDKGELDKMLEQAGRQVAGDARSEPPQRPADPYRKDHEQAYYGDKKYDPKYSQGKPYKKKSFLDDLFDF